MKKAIIILVCTATVLGLSACRVTSNQTSEVNSQQISEENVVIEETQPQYHTLGETVSTDMFDFSLTNVFFSKSAKLTDGPMLNTYEAERGKVLLNFEMSVIYTGKEEFTLLAGANRTEGKYFAPKVVYGDGYEFTSFTFSSSESKYGDTPGGWEISTGTTLYWVDLKPLDSKTIIVKGYFEVPTTVEDESEESLLMEIYLCGDIITYDIQKKGNETLETGGIFDAVTLSDLPPEEYLGATITNYKPLNGTDTPWQIFFAGSVDNETPHIYLIANDYIHKDYVPERAAIGVLDEYAFTVNRDDRYKDGTKWIDDERVKELSPEYFKKLASAPKNSNDNEGIIRSMALLDFDVWKDFCDDVDAEFAIGGPTYELYAASYNQKFNYGIDVIVPSTNGYYWGSKISSFTSTGIQVETSDRLYVISSSEKANGMWLASSTDDKGLMDITYFGMFGSGDNNLVCGLRPVIRLKADTSIEMVETGIFKIVN